MTLQNVGIFLVGAAIGFLGGLFGKGGSAIATPLLSLIGVPGFVAVAAPLPATIPGTFIAAFAYWRSKLVDWELIAWSIAVGLPATIVGSYLTRFTGDRPLLIVTGVLVLGFGISFLRHRETAEAAVDDGTPEALVRPPYWRVRVVGVALFVGLISGLLANSGGFLLAPSYARILNQPIKRAFASSLIVSMVLAIPGTIVHASLGHIDWTVTAVLALGSVPFSYIGARTAIRTDAHALERVYGLVLTVLGAYFLLRLV